MRSNEHAKPAKVNGNPSTGNGKPLAKMPANNVGTFPVKMGSGQKSQFGQGVQPGTAQKGAVQSKGSKANMPANNITDRSVKMGNTKHGVGEVPGYLKSY